MKKAYRITILFFASALCGCVNMYERAPWTDPEIRSVYQCSRAAAGMSVIVAFPQMMSDAPHLELILANIFTVPVGCLCLCDAACEAVIDTACLPFDCFLAKRREGD